MQDQRIQYVEKQAHTQNRWAIGDVHGCIYTLKKLIENIIQPTPQDQLFFLGDYIDRGTDSKAVLDYILSLKQHCETYCLRGNHEQMLLDNYDAYYQAEDREVELEYLTSYMESYNITNLLCYEQALYPTLYAEHEAFLRTLPYLFVLDHFYLVHAGVNFHAPQPLQDFESMLWTRKTPLKNSLNDKQVIHGHTPTPFTNIKLSIQEKNSHINLDNGCVYSQHEGTKSYRQRQSLGRLCAFNLDTSELRFALNCEPTQHE